jgi:Domain of unknown function (DUF5666)
MDFRYGRPLALTIFPVTGLALGGCGGGGGGGSASAGGAQTPVVAVDAADNTIKHFTIFGQAVVANGTTVFKGEDGMSYTFADLADGDHVEVSGDARRLGPRGLRLARTLCRWSPIVFPELATPSGRACQCASRIQ